MLKTNRQKKTNPCQLLSAFTICLLILFNPFFSDDFVEGAGKKNTKKIVYKKLEDDGLIYKKGISYYENAEYERAVEYFKRVCDETPDSFYYDMALYLTGESYFKLDKKDEAVSHYALLMKKCPKSNLAPEALHNIAEIYRKKGVSGEAIKYYKYIADLYPSSFWAEEARAFIKYNRIDTPAADANDVRPASAKGRSVDEKIKVDGIDDIKNIDFDKLTMSSFISGNKTYEPVDYRDEDLDLYHEALKFHEARNFDRAKTIYQKFILKYKNSLWYPNAFYMLGSCYLATGDIKAAIRFYSAALIYCLENKLQREIKQNLADLLYIDTQYMLALRYYESLALEEGEKMKLMQLYFLIGECNSKLGNNELASKAYARVALETEDMKAAEKIVKTAAGKKRPLILQIDDTTPGTSEVIATLANPLKTVEISAAKKERIELKNIINEGISEFNDKNYMKAISALEKALVRGNDEPDVLWYLALSYQQVEKLQKSAEYMQKYISVSEKLKEPPHPMHDARSILAYLFIKQNNFDSARSEYLKIISLDPGSRPAQSAHDALKRIEIMKKRSVEEAADGKEDLKKASGDASINIEKDDEE